jgi:hypothetical protein
LLRKDMVNSNPVATLASITNGDGALEPEELAIVQKALDRIAKAFTT